jgi:hypothetical protein
MSTCHRSGIGAVAALALLGAGSTLWAAPITVPNNSFETVSGTVAADWSNTIDLHPADLVGSKVGTYASSAIPAVTGVDGSHFIRLYNIGWSGASPHALNNGTQITVSSAASLGAFQANTTYTLTAGAAMSSASNPTTAQSLGLGLSTAALTTYAATSVDNSVFFTGNALTANSLQDYSLVVDTAAHPELVGQDMYISLMFYSTYSGGDRSAYFDNVRLDAVSAPIPEPASLGLLALGALGLLRRTRKA